MKLAHSMFEFHIFREFIKDAGGPAQIMSIIFKTILAILTLFSLTNLIVRSVY